MTKDQFIALIAETVHRSCDLKNKHTEEINAPVNYCAIFSQNDEEYLELHKRAIEIGKVIESTATGDLFEITPIDTVSGRLRLLKIRKPDRSRKERGDADFTVLNYQNFKEICSKKAGFSFIERDTYEMIELIDQAFPVRAYFSYPALDSELGLK